MRYGVAQAWIHNEIRRGRVNIQEAVDRVAHTGQTEGALHCQPRHGRPTKGIIVKLVLVAHMVGDVLHASRAQRAQPQWTIQVYTPPQAWPFLAGAVLRHHVALVTGWHPHRQHAGHCPGPPHLAGRPGHPLALAKGRPPVAHAVERLSLTGTLQRHPNKMARPFLQIGTVPAALPGSGWK